MKWIYLSPHLDDVVYSCGGLIWEQVQSGVQVEIWTICAGDVLSPLSPYAQSLHTRWQTGPEAVFVRRAEDLEACQKLGVLAKHFDIPDCIYRYMPQSGEPVVSSDNGLFSPLKTEESYLVEKLAGQLESGLLPQTKVVCPLTVGGHMDHRLTRMAAEALRRSLLVLRGLSLCAGRGRKSGSICGPEMAGEPIPDHRTRLKRLAGSCCGL